MTRSHAHFANRSRFCRLVPVLAFLATLAWPAMAQEPIKIAVVDVDRVVALSETGKALDARLKALEQELRAKLEEKAQTVQNLRASAAGKTPDEQRELGKQIEDERLAAQRLQEDSQREMNKEQQVGLERIREQLRPVFEQIQAESAYDLILNFNPQIVVAVGERVDITPRVMELLDAGTPGSSTSGN